MLAEVSFSLSKFCLPLAEILLLKFEEAKQLELLTVSYVRGFLMKNSASRRRVLQGLMAGAIVI